MNEREKLKERFNFKKPVVFKDLEKGYNVEALPDMLIIAGDADMYERELPGMLALAKLGEEDFLLTTFIIEPEQKKSDEKYCKMFSDLCKPLQAVWVMKILRQYAPEIYEKEFEKIYKLKDVSLSFFLICCENREIKKMNKTRAGIEEISPRKELLQFCQMEPDVAIYLKLPEATGAPYEVGIDGTRETRHYVIREKTKKKEWRQ